MVRQQESFDETATRIVGLVIESIRNRRPIEEKILDEPDCVYLKSADGRLIFGNTAYQQVFTAGACSSGLQGASFLPPTIITVARCSDALLLSGCARVQFEHVGHDARGRTLRFHTAKHSLLGCGNRQLAILGITRIVDVEDKQPTHPTIQLSEKWHAFQQLSPQDQQIAIAIGRGIPPAEIAQELRVSRKTVEIHRTAILQALDLASPVDLIKLLVRVQDNGYGDLGL